MPISAIDGCDERHWVDVKEVIFQAIIEAELLPQLVSDAIEIGIIHKRIVQNIYDNPIVVCDLSGRNPNVMLELGMRLAFDKPVIVVKDDKTNFSFDSSPIEHVTYPRDLHFQSIVAFKATLRDKILAMLKGKNEHSFLKSFGTFKTSKLEHEEGTPFDAVLEELKIIKSALRQSEFRSPFESREPMSGFAVSLADKQPEVGLGLRVIAGDNRTISRFIGALKAMTSVMEVERALTANGDRLIYVNSSHSDRNALLERIKTTVFSMGGLWHRNAED